ncbi:ninjurin-A isoform X2 [Papilio machaon]|uniref:ninjurin-A isoform X2 n=1 Tax=Papilio machaon TaxID=76193 RepID=UPI001E666025|nr:ninjurin-A isoform X2 [Papilio machaon]
MSSSHSGLSKVESPKMHGTKPLDLNDVEMVFGTPTSPRDVVKPDVHRINERTHGKDTLNTHIDGHEAEAGHPSQPLLEPEKERPKPPLAGPEVDDLDEEKPSDANPFPGIDDGLLEPGDTKHDGPHEGSEEKSGDGSTHPTHDDGIGTDEDGVNGFGNRFNIDDRPGSPFPPPGSIPDVNTYQQKKNLAQGMMDLALLSANANQMRYVLESSTSHPYFYPSLVFISLSVIFQIAVGVGLIMNSRYDVKDEKEICKADKINNMTVLGIFLITIVNVFITSFSVATPTAVSAVGAAVVQQAG